MWKDLEEISSTIKLDITESGKIQLQTHVENSQKDAITDMVNDCGKNSKKLYTLITNLTGILKETPLP